MMITATTTRRQTALMADEACLAGSAVLSPDLIFAAVKECPPAAVDDHTCRAVYGGVAAMVDMGVTVTPGRLLIHMDAIGVTLSADVMRDIADSVPSGVHLCYYARRVADAAQRRALAARLDAITRETINGAPMDEVVANITTLAHEVAA